MLLHAIWLGLMISWNNKLNVIGFIRYERFCCEEHMYASELRAAYFPSAMAAREGRQGSARVARKGGREL